MTSPTVNDGSARPLLTLGTWDRVRVQVGYRGASPEDPALRTLPARSPTQL